MIKAAKNEYVYPKGDLRAKTDWIETGSYALNALLSGSIRKGMPDNRSIMLAGEAATGKTFFTLSICKAATAAGYFIVYIDTEGEKDEELFANFGFKGRGIDYEIMKVKTVEKLRTEVYAMLDVYKEMFKTLNPNENLSEYVERPKVLFVVDSIGFLTSEADQANLAKGEVKSNLKLPMQLKSFFKDVTIDMNVCKIPLIIVSHVYDSMDMYATNSASMDNGKKVGGGSGGSYGASAIIMLKAKEMKVDAKVYSDKDGKNVSKKINQGTYFTGKAIKSRYIRKGSEVDIYVGFSTGIARNFGLQRFCEGQLVESVSRGSKGTFYKLICKEKNEKGEYPEVKSYVNEIPNMLEEIDAVVKKTFQFGNEVDSETGELVGANLDESDSEPNPEDYSID